MEESSPPPSPLSRVLPRSGGLDSKSGAIWGVRAGCFACGFPSLFALRLLVFLIRSVVEPGSTCARPPLPCVRVGGRTRPRLSVIRVAPASKKGQKRANGIPASKVEREWGEEVGRRKRFGPPYVFVPECSEKRPPPKAPPAWGGLLGFRRCPSKPPSVSFSYPAPLLPAAYPVKRGKAPSSPRPPIPAPPTCSLLSKDGGGG